MGREAIVEDDEEVCKRTEKVNSLVESLRTTYTDSVKESLRNYELNFVICDPRLSDNPIVYASEGFCKMSGYSQEEVLGRNCRFLQGTGTDRRTVLELRDAVREERSAQVRILNYTKEGKPFWNLFHLAPVFSRLDGTVTHFVGVQTPVPSQLATSQAEKETILSRLNKSFEPAQNLPAAVDKLNDLRKNVELDVGSPEPGCPRPDSGDCGSNGFSHRFPNLERNSNQVVLSSSSGNMHSDEMGADEAVTTRLASGGLGASDDCKPRGPESVKATDATRSIVSQLVESSKGKGEVLQSREKQRSECSTSGVVCSSLLLSLSRIQQSFVLADPNLPDAPIVHASDLFLHLTGYSREEVMGRNCRFLQGPGTALASVAEIGCSPCTNVELSRSWMKLRRCLQQLEISIDPGMYQLGEVMLCSDSKLQEGQETFLELIARRSRSMLQRQGGLFRGSASPGVRRRGRRDRNECTDETVGYCWSCTCCSTKSPGCRITSHNLKCQFIGVHSF